MNMMMIQCKANSQCLMDIYAPYGQALNNNAISKKFLGKLL